MATMQGLGAHQTGRRSGEFWESKGEGMGTVQVQQQKTQFVVKRLSVGLNFLLVKWK